MARRWEEAGASLLHVVDLDGARAGHPVQGAIVAAIAAALAIPVQASGGLRRPDDVAAALGSGPARVVLGTAVLEDRGLLRAALARWGGERIVVGIDARDGLVATHGWRETTTTPAVELAREVAALGVRRVVYTDISRDATLTGPNYAALGELAAIDGLALIASGGVGSRDHLVALAAIPGVEGAIVGQALYTGAVVLGSGEWEMTSDE